MPIGMALTSHRLCALRKSTPLMFGIATTDGCHGTNINVTNLRGPLSMAGMNCASRA
ncbi:MAG: hypothetical protein ACTS6J_14370 [Burkholderiales bacterium]